MIARQLYHLMVADLLERIRRPDIWLVTALGVGCGVLFLPPTDAETLMIALGPWRGLYNSAWIGLVFGLLAAMVLPLFSFYVVKNTIRRDRETRVGQIIATTPVGRIGYLLGKWLSNLAILTILLLILSLMAVIMQLWRGEAAIELGQLLAPLWLLGFPVMAWVAALALLFETIRFLAGGVGNLLYFFGWILFLSQIALPGLFRAQVGLIVPGPDFLGITRPLAALQGLARQVDPLYQGHLNIAGASYGVVPDVVVWEGVVWSGALVAERLSWLVGALVLVLLTGLLFDRFDPARQGSSTGQIRFRRPKAAVASATLDVEEVRSSARELRRLAPIASPPAFLRLVQAELRLLIHGRSRWLLAAAAAATLLSAVAPPGDGPPAAALAWLWPVILWSELGTRTRAHRTHALVYAAPSPHRAQFWAAWLAGVGLGLAATMLLGLRYLLGGEIDQWLGMLVGTLFVPSLALALGKWSGNGRFFLVTYLLVWFPAASGNHWLDFMSFRPEAAEAGIPLLYLLAAGVALSLAWAAEKSGRLAHW